MLNPRTLKYCSFDHRSGRTLDYCCCCDCVYATANLRFGYVTTVNAAGRAAPSVAARGGQHVVDSRGCEMYTRMRELALGTVVCSWTFAVDCVLRFYSEIRWACSLKTAAHAVSRLCCRPAPAPTGGAPYAAAHRLGESAIADGSGAGLDGRDFRRR